MMRVWTNLPPSKTASDSNNNNNDNGNNDDSIIEESGGNIDNIGNNNSRKRRVLRILLAGPHSAGKTSLLYQFQKLSRSVAVEKGGEVGEYREGEATEDIKPGRCHISKIQWKDTDILFFDLAR